MAAHPSTIDGTSRHGTARAGRTTRLLAVSVTLGLAIAASPLPDLPGGYFADDGAAWARGGGNGGGNGGAGGNGGGGNGGGNGAGSGDRGGDTAAGRGGGWGRGGDDSAPRGGGWGRGGGVAVSTAGDDGRRGRGKSEARERYAASLERGGRRGGEGGADDFGRREARLDPTLSATLVANGWQGRASLEGTGFRNHGERVSTMVELARTLGYGAHVGALQANFGGPYGEPAGEQDDTAREALNDELGALRDELAALEDQDGPTAQAMAERIEAIEAELAALDATAGTEPEWDGDWRTANLDVNGDGVVDRTDLELARAALDEPASEEPAEQPDVGDTLAETPGEDEPTTEDSALDDGDATDPSIDQAAATEPTA